MNNDLTDTEKITLLRRMFRQHFPLPILLLLVVAVVEPLVARQLIVNYSQRM